MLHCLPLKAIAVLALSGTVTMGSLTAAAANTKILRIAPAKSKINLTNYYVSEVVDDRVNKSDIGYITTGAYNYFLKANFEQPLKDEISQFISEGVNQNPGGTPVSLHVVEYALSEKSSFKGAEIALTTHYVLYAKGGGRLLDYSTVDTRGTGMNMGAFAAQLMRNNLANFLASTDNNIRSVVALMKSNQEIAVSYVLVTEPALPQLKPYNPQRPINIRNFGGKIPANAQGMAGAESGLRVTYQIRNIDGAPKAIVELLPYFDQSKAWIKSGNELSKTLAYQQTFFKIAAYVTNEFIKELGTRKFVMAGLEKDLEEMKNRYATMLKEMQQKFLAETNYGEDIAMVNDWNRNLSFYPSPFVASN
ncbi:MAG: hypothetical protein QM642_03945 [Edaphocola sp.]